MSFAQPNGGGGGGFPKQRPHVPPSGSDESKVFPFDGAQSHKILPSGSVPVEEVIPLVRLLLDPVTREMALLELSRRREACVQMAPLLWHSFGVSACIVQELLSIYPQLNPPALNGPASNRVCNAIALLQCIAAHPNTVGPFMESGMVFLLFPLLDATTPGRNYEYLRLTSLGVVGAMLKAAPAQAVPMLLQSELVPLTLRIVESGTDIAKVVATFILQVILQEPTGLAFLCASAERFYGVVTILGGVLRADNFSARLLRHILRCALRMSEGEGMAAPLASAFLPYLQLPAVQATAAEDPVCEELYRKLNRALAVAHTSAASRASGSAAAPVAS